MKLKAWIRALRLRTLPLALSSVGMGAFLAAFYNKFNLHIFILSTTTTLFLQILSNLANDYGDTKSGVDHLNRQGPSRTVQAGLISLNEMLIGIIIVATLTLVTGIWLLGVSFHSINYTFIIFLFLGLAAIAAALKYTMGKNPYGYKGYGDIFVLLFFGIVAVSGSYYLYSKTFSVQVLLPSASFGFLATGVLNVNNIRDIDSDEEAGKYSIPVRIGRKNAIIYHWILLLLAFVLVITFTYINFRSWWQLLFLMTLPLFIRNGVAVYRYENAKELDPYLRQLAISSSLFTLLFGAGLLLS